jgi:hypothetical protein
VRGGRAWIDPPAFTSGRRHASPAAGKLRNLTRADQKARYIKAL